MIPNDNFFFVLGAETTAKLIKMHVLVYGLRGVGAETCKNLALQGVGGITVSYSVFFESILCRISLLSFMIFHDP